MEHHEDMITKKEALEQIRRGLRRAALIYNFFAATIIDELGEEKGTTLIRKAVEAYGQYIGRTSKAKALEKGLPLLPENFQDDLPMMAWEAETVVVDGEERVRIHHCPLAVEWIALGEPKRARTYCFVDQAKMAGFNPDYEYVHLKNVLDGDPYCELVVRPRKM